jgi:endonuclease/exonuclease/phosphatase (EEP) superfamily protein YafD
LRKLIWAVFAVSLVLTVASFGGALFGLGDSLAVFLHWWAVALSLSSALLLAGHRRVAVLGLAVVVVAVVPMARGFLSANSTPAGRYTFYQKNLLYNGTGREAIIADIQALAPDFVTLEEVSYANRTVFETLKRSYATSLFCRFNGVGGIAVLSKWPQIEGSANCAGEQGLAAVQVKTPDGVVWAVALHLDWPFPYDQRQQVKSLTRAMRLLTGPVVLGGDFNMVPWSQTMRDIENATGSLRAGPVLRTLKHATLPLRLPIDHILVPSGQARAELRPRFGSDHYGLLLNFDL